MPAEEDGANRWRLGTWRFVQVVGGTHTYQTNQVINSNFPDAFTRVRDTEPSLAIDASLPAQNGYTYRIHGDNLQSVELETILQLNAGEAWEFY